MNNLSSLTVGHRASAYKKRAKREQVKEILFDDEARRHTHKHELHIYMGLIQTSYRDYLTGFRKRNLLKKEASKKRREEREKLERQELRREVRFYLESNPVHILT
jgi:ribosomal RNA-processing protein 17